MYTRTNWYVTIVAPQLKSTVVCHHGDGGDTSLSGRERSAAIALHNTFNGITVMQPAMASDNGDIRAEQSNAAWKNKLRRCAYSFGARPKPG